MQAGPNHDTSGPRGLKATAGLSMHCAAFARVNSTSQNFLERIDTGTVR